VSLTQRKRFGLPIGMTLAILRTPGVWRKAAKLLVRVRWSAPPSLPAAIGTTSPGGDRSNVD
jgi:hypothetical protein